MELSIRPLKGIEQNYTYTQSSDIIADSGCIGHLRVDMDYSGTGFFSTWDTHSPEKKDAAFKAEFDEVINALRFDDSFGGILKNRKLLTAYCNQNYAESVFPDSDSRNFGFRVDTEEYSYLLRLNPNRGEYAAYIYAYDKDMLDAHLQEQEKDMSTMTVLVVEPEKVPYVKEIGTGLESLQEAVAGDIEAVYPFAEPVAILCNEEGKINGLPLNRALRDNTGEIYDILAGTFLVVGLGEEDFTSLSDELLKQFSEKFKYPERFLRLNEKLVVMPMDIAPDKQESLLEKLHDFDSAVKAAQPHTDKFAAKKQVL